MRVRDHNYTLLLPPSDDLLLRGRLDKISYDFDRDFRRIHDISERLQGPGGLSLSFDELQQFVVTGTATQHVIPARSIW
jgi:hypothetical protein